MQILQFFCHFRYDHSATFPTFLFIENGLVTSCPVVNEFVSFHATSSKITLTLLSCHIFFSFSKSFRGNIAINIRWSLIMNADPWYFKDFRCKNTKLLWLLKAVYIGEGYWILSMPLPLINARHTHNACNYHIQMWCGVRWLRAAEM